MPHLPLLNQVVLAHRLEGEHALLARHRVAVQRETHVTEGADAEDRAQLEIVEAETLLGSKQVSTSLLTTDSSLPPFLTHALTQWYLLWWYLLSGTY